MEINGIKLTKEKVLKIIKDYQESAEIKKGSFFATYQIFENFKTTYKNDWMATRTLEVNKAMEVVQRDFKAVMELNGIKLRDAQLKRNKRGYLTFTCGYGYDVIDADLLGGDGSGQVKELLEMCLFNLIERVENMYKSNEI